MAGRGPSKESNLSDSCCECHCQCCAVDGEEREDAMPGGPQVTLRLSLDVQGYLHGLMLPCTVPWGKPG